MLVLSRLLRTMIVERSVHRNIVLVTLLLRCCIVGFVSFVYRFDHSSLLDAWSRDQPCRYRRSSHHHRSFRIDLSTTALRVLSGRTAHKHGARVEETGYHGTTLREKEDTQGSISLPDRIAPGLNGSQCHRRRKSLPSCR